jgi:hypothetical protein
MKTIILTITLCVFVISGFTQNATSKTPRSSGAITINVPNFDNPATTKFYDAYTTHIKNAITAIRNKDEAAWKNLTKEEKNLAEKEKQMLKTKPTPEDIKRKRAWNIQAMPYIQEIDQSDFNKKLEKQQE